MTFDRPTEQLVDQNVKARVAFKWNISEHLFICGSLEEQTGDFFIASMITLNLIIYTFYETLVQKQILTLDSFWPASIQRTGPVFTNILILRIVLFLEFFNEFWSFLRKILKIRIFQIWNVLKSSILSKFKEKWRATS